MTERFSKYLKAAVALLACVGIVVSPDQQESILAGFLAIYGIISGTQGKMFKK